MNLRYAVMLLIFCCLIAGCDTQKTTSLPRLGAQKATIIVNDTNSLHSHINSKETKALIDTCLPNRNGDIGPDQEGYQKITLLPDTKCENLYDGDLNIIAHEMSKVILEARVKDIPDDCINNTDNDLGLCWDMWSSIIENTISAHVAASSLGPWISSKKVHVFFHSLPSHRQILEYDDESFLSAQKVATLDLLLLLKEAQYLRTRYQSFVTIAKAVHSWHEETHDWLTGSQIPEIQYPDISVMDAQEALQTLAKSSVSGASTDYTKQYLEKTEVHEIAKSQWLRKAQQQIAEYNQLILERLEIAGAKKSTFEEEIDQFVFNAITLSKPATLAQRFFSVSSRPNRCFPDLQISMDDLDRQRNNQAKCYYPSIFPLDGALREDVSILANEKRNNEELVGQAQPPTVKVMYTNSSGWRVKSLVDLKIEYEEVLGNTGIQTQVKKWDLSGLVYGVTATINENDKGGHLKLDRAESWQVKVSAKAVEKNFRDAGLLAHLDVTTANLTYENETAKINGFFSFPQLSLGTSTQVPFSVPLQDVRQSKIEQLAENATVSLVKLAAANSRQCSLENNKQCDRVLPVLAPSFENNFRVHSLSIRSLSPLQLRVGLVRKSNSLGRVDLDISMDRDRLWKIDRSAIPNKNLFAYSGLTGNSLTAKEQTELTKAVERVNNLQNDFQNEMDKTLNALNTNGAIDLNFASQLIDQHVTAIAQYRLAEPAKRILGLNSVTNAVKNELTNNISTIMNSATWALNSTVAEITKISPLKVDLPIAAEHDTWVTQGGAPRTRTNATVLNAFGLNNSDEFESWVWRNVGVQLQPVLTLAVNLLWEDPAVVECVTLGVGNCMIPSEAVNELVGSLSSMMMLGADYRNMGPNQLRRILCDAQTESPSFDQLMVCPEVFGIDPKTFAEVKQRIFETLLEVGKESLTNSWNEYLGSAATQLMHGLDQSLENIIPFDAKSIIGSQLLESHAEALKKDVLVGIIRNKLEDQFGYDKNAGFEFLAQRVDVHAKKMVEHAALNQKILPPIFDAVDYIEQNLASTQSQVHELEQKWDTQLESTKALAKVEVLQRLEVIDVQAVVGEGVGLAVNGFIAPRLPTKTSQLEIPKFGLTAHKILLLDTEAFDAQAKRIVESSQIIESSLNQSRQLLETEVSKNLGAVKIGILQSCTELLGDEFEHLCEKPDSLWKTVTGYALPAWPSHVVATIKLELLNAQREMIDENINDVMSAIEIAEINACSSDSENLPSNIIAAYANACNEMFSHIKTELPNFIKHCNDGAIKSNSKNCLPRSHEILVQAFVSSLFPDDELKAAAWNYALSYTVASENLLSQQKEIFLKRQSACVSQYEGFPSGIRLSQPGSCVGTEIEIGSPLQLEDLQNNIEAALTQKSEEIKNRIKSNLKACARLPESSDNFAAPEFSNNTPCASPFVEISNLDQLEALQQKYKELQIEKFEKSIVEPLENVCVSAPKAGMNWEQTEDMCFNFAALTNTKALGKFQQEAKSKAEKFIETQAKSMLQEVNALATAYGASIVVVGGEYCLKSSNFFSSELICASTLQDLRERIGETFNAISPENILNALESKAKETILNAAAAEINSGCERIRTMLADVKLLGEAVRFDLGDDSLCPPKLLNAKGKFNIAGLSDVEVSGRLFEQSGRLQFDWTTIKTNPSLEEVVSHTLEQRFEGLSVIQVELEKKGLWAKVEYYPKVMPFPVVANVEFGSNGLSLDIDFNSSQTTSLILKEVCTEFHGYFKRTQLELMPDTRIDNLDQPFCEKNGLRALKFDVVTKLEKPMGDIELGVIVSLDSGIKVLAPNFKDLFASALADFLDVGSIGIKPLKPWYTNDDGLTLHLGLAIPIPVLEMRAKTEVSLNAKKVEFSGPISLEIDRWIDTPSGIAFGDFGLEFNPQEDILALRGSCSISTGDVTSRVFRVDGVATFYLNDAKIEVEGTSRLISVLELSNSKTTIYFKERLFSHEISTGPMLAEVIEIEGNLRVQIKPGNPFVTAKGRGNLFGAEVLDLEVALEEDLSADMSAKLDIADNSVTFDFTADEYLSNPQVGTSTKLLGMKVKIAASPGTASASAYLFDQPLASISAPDLSKLDWKQLQIDFDIKLGKLELSDSASFSQIVSDGEQTNDDGGDSSGDQQEGEGFEEEKYDEEIIAPGQRWFDAAVAVKKYRERQDCWFNIFGKKIGCKTVHVPWWDKQIKPSFQKIDSLEGLGWQRIYDHKMQFRNEPSNHLVQVKDGNELRIYEIGATAKLIWTGKLGAPSGCRVPFFKDGIQPNFSVLHHKNGSPSFILAVTEGNNPTLATLENGATVHEGKCNEGETAQTLLRFRKLAGDEGILALYDLFIEHRNSPFTLRNVWEDSLALIEIKLPDKEAVWMSHNEKLDGDFAFIKLDEIAGLDINRQFLNEKSIRDAFWKNLEHLCNQGSEVNTIDDPCAMTTILGNGAKMVLLERGDRSSDRYVRLFSKTGVDFYATRTKWESTLNDDFWWDQKNRKELDRFFSSFNAKKLGRLIFKSNGYEEWLATYTAIDDLDAATISTNQVKSLGSDNLPQKFLASSTFDCINRASQSQLLGKVPFAPSSKINEDTLVEGLLAEQQEWFNKGWMVNPLGTLSFYEMNNGEGICSVNP